MASSRPRDSAFAESRPVIRFSGARGRAPAASPLGGSPLQVQVSELATSACVMPLAPQRRHDHLHSTYHRHDSFRLCSGFDVFQAGPLLAPTTPRTATKTHPLTLDNMISSLLLQGTSPTRSIRPGSEQPQLGSPFAVASQQRALGDQYEEANAHTWTSGITGSGWVVPDRRIHGVHL